MFDIMKPQLEELLHPTMGLMRGLRSSDADDKIIGMKVGELRRVTRLLEYLSAILEDQDAKNKRR